MFLSVRIVLVLLATPFAVQGQQAGQSKVGLLFLGTAGIDSTERSDIAVRKGLRELGWVENQNIHFQYHFAGGQRDRLDQLAGELVKHKVISLKTAKVLGLSAPQTLLLRADHVIQ